MKKSIRSSWTRFLVIIGASVLMSGCSFFESNTIGGLQVITNDVPASVHLDGEFLNKTPLIEKDLQAGEYRVKIQPDDTKLAAHETTLHIRPGTLTVLAWKPGATPETSGGVSYEMLQLADSTRTEVSFVTSPDGAIITFGDGTKEFSPVLIPSLPAGEHTFEISLPSYETQKHSLQIVAGYRMIITVKLAKILDNQTSQSSTTPEPVLETPNATASASPSGSLRSAKAVTIKPTGFFQSGQEVLRVRSLPESNAAELGVVPVGSSHPYLGTTEKGWHKITYKDKEGWVSEAYSQLTQ